MTDLAAVLAFAADHPILTWCVAWGVWPISWMISSVLSAPFRYAFTAYNRHLRSKNIALRGWPEHPLMDADGDIVHPKETARD